MMSERRVFESLCMEPGSGGFSYDAALLVDVDRAVDFDEAVIRLTTKCSSIITQLSTLGHPVSEFSIACARVGAPPSAGRTKIGRSGHLEDAFHPRAASTPEGRNLLAMEELWCGLKRKNYSGMVAVARLSRSSIPRNGCGARYSVQVLKEALLSHIQAYFMFQAYNPMFQPWSTASRDKEDDAQAEYLMFLVYRIQPRHPGSTPTPEADRKRSRRPSELDKLETSWPFAPTPTKRKRQLSSGSSVSSSSSVSNSSSPSGGTTHLLPSPTPAAAPSPVVVLPRCPLFPGSKEHDSYGLDWGGVWPVSGKRGSPTRKSVEGVAAAAAAGSRMVLRHRRPGTTLQPQSSEMMEDG